MKTKPVAQRFFRAVEPESRHTRAGTQAHAPDGTQRADGLCSADTVGLKPDGSEDKGLYRADAEVKIRLLR